MKKNLAVELKKYVDERGIPLLGAASAELLNRTAPEGFRPRDYLPGAKTMLILAKPLPLSVLLVPDDHDYNFYVRAFTTSYNLMNDVANDLALMMEKEGYRSLPVPAYSPLKFHQGEPWGTMSFKHAAAAAGLGKIGKNTLFIHPEYGNILRFGGVLTEMDWPAGRPAEFKNLCPEGCALCVHACPVGALKDGKIDKTACMTRCIRHVMMPPRIIMRLLRSVMRKSGKMSRLMEQLTLNFFEEYSIGCMACLTSCPHFPGYRQKSREIE